MPDIAESSLLASALQYAGRGWRVIRLHTIIDGRCTCGRPTCADSRGKHPWGLKRGLKDATTDREVIERWWRARPAANVGVLTGGGLVVIDVDSPANAQALARLAAAHGPFPPTVMVTTGRGVHLYFQGDIGGSHTVGETQLLIRGEGGYVVAPPSLHHSGRRYAWDDPSAPIAPLPDWFRAWVLRAGGPGSRIAARAAREAAPSPHLGPRPPWLAPADRIGDLHERALAPTRGERPSPREFITELARIPASVGMHEWFVIGCAIHDWDDGADGLAIFKAWSKTSARHQWTEAEPRCEYEWRRMGIPKPGKDLVTWARVFHEAARYAPRAVQQEAKQTAPSTGHVNGFNHSLPNGQTFAGANGAAFDTFDSTAGANGPIRWIDTDEDGNPRATCTNARIAIRGLGVDCRKDVFHEKLIVGGHAIDQWAGDLSDDAVLMMRQLIKTAFRFDPGEKHARDAAVQLCLINQFDPVRDYLDSLQWDGRDRVATWLSAYLGARDDTLTREFARIVLVAAVRRIYQPGAKFDEILVLEGPEGKGKSTALRVLAGEDNFSDARVLGLGEREQLENTTGVWIHEISELAGMRRAEVEAVKAFASRQEDRARPAFGRFRIDRPRRCIFVATTNTRTYLRSDTGDRRFWPVETGEVDIDGLRRDRDQLWAEAVALHRRGESIRLNAKWWGEAGKLQASRQELDPWHDQIAAWIEKKQVRDTSVFQVVTEFLQLEISRVGQVEQNRAARVLRMLGFEKYRRRDEKQLTWRYRRIDT